MRLLEMMPTLSPRETPSVASPPRMSSTSFLNWAYVVYTQEGPLLVPKSSRGLNFSSMLSRRSTSETMLVGEAIRGGVHYHDRESPCPATSSPPSDAK